METVKNEYVNAYKKYGKSSESLFFPKGRQRERYELLTQFIIGDNFSILDFGCGFGDLRSYIFNKFSNFKYLGVDIVDEFIAENLKESDDFLLIKDENDIDGEFDYICISGTFNISYYDDINFHKDRVKKVLKKLFDNNLSENGILSVDFMHDEVDFKADKAYHINVGEMYSFFSSELSNRVVINKDVFPYEVTFNIFKNTKIDRDKNLYVW